MHILLYQHFTVRPGKNAAFKMSTFEFICGVLSFLFLFTTLLVTANFNTVQASLASFLSVSAHRAEEPQDFIVFVLYR